MATDIADNQGCCLDAGSYSWVVGRQRSQCLSLLKDVQSQYQSGLARCWGLLDWR